MSEAAFKGDIAMMERLVAKGASVNQHDQVFPLPDHATPPPSPSFQRSNLAKEHAAEQCRECLSLCIFRRACYVFVCVSVHVWVRACVSLCMCAYVSV